VVLASADTVAKVVVKERLMARYPQPTQHLVGDHPIRAGIADEDAGHDISQRHCLVKNEPYVE
jgi:hypothetical protein